MVKLYLAGLSRLMDRTWIVRASVTPLKGYDVMFGESHVPYSYENGWNSD